MIIKPKTGNGDIWIIIISRAFDLLEYTINLIHSYSEKKRYFGINFEMIMVKDQVFIEGCKSME